MYQCETSRMSFPHRNEYHRRDSVVCDFATVGSDQMSASLFNEINLRIMLSPGLPNVGIPKPFWEPLQSKHARVINRTRPRGLASVHDASSHSLVKREILCWRTGYCFPKGDIAERKASKKCPFRSKGGNKGKITVQPCTTGSQD
jgi:hypothetical protein